MKIKTLVVDDEPLARERLIALLRQEPGVEIAAECGDGASALEAVRQHAPDLLFLDVQMPELDGLEVLRALGPAAPPAVIFVTAYDKFAVQAFELHAVDYLLKPFDRQRLQVALQRARDRLQHRQSGALQQQLAALLHDLRPTERPSAERLAVKCDGRVVLLKQDDIDWVEAADNYVILHVGQEKHMLRETMSAIEARLPASRFVRINRSNIVNIERVKELHPLFHGEYVVVLRNGAKLNLSRNYRDKLPALGWE